jgi:hypothetical protein
VSTDAQDGVSDATAVSPSLTRGEAAAWYLRNFAVLLGAFFPALATLGVTVDCMFRPAEKACAFALPKVLYIWIILAIPAAVVGGVHLLLVLWQALRRPWIARALAAALLPGLALGFGGAAWARAYPAGLPVLTLGGIAYAAMLRLEPRDRLGDALWVWAVTPGLAVLYVALFIAGLV